MNNLELTRQAFAFVLYIFAQIWVIRYIELFHVAYCFLYINFLLLMPISINRVAALLLGLLLGLAIDIFDDTLGVQAAACVLLAYLRPFWLGIITERNEASSLLLRDTGLSWFVRYAGVMILVHHLMIFYLQQFNWQLAGLNLLKVIASTALTLFMCILVQYMFYSPALRNVRG